MTTGYVNAALEPVIEIEVGNDRGEFITVQAVLDTGFYGHLTLTQRVVEQLQLPAFAQTRSLLGDGQIVMATSYIGRVIWQEQEVIVAVEMTTDSRSLIGMELLMGTF